MKLKNPSDKSVIFANASNLKGKTNGKKKSYFIQEDMTEEQTEQRQFYRDLVKENNEKPAEQKRTIKMQRGNIIVNDMKIKQKVKTPKDADILCLSACELDQIKAFKIIKGVTHEERESEFISYAAKVASEKDVQTAYLKMRIKYADASHVSCAYRLSNPDSPCDQGAIDNKDYGIAHAVLKVMKDKDITEMAIFIVHYYGGIQLGKRRFEIASDLTNSAIKGWYSHLAKKDKRRSRLNSQGSMASIESTLSQAEDTDDTKNDD